MKCYFSSFGRVDNVFLFRNNSHFLSFFRLSPLFSQPSLFFRVSALTLIILVLLFLTVTFTNECLECNKCHMSNSSQSTFAYRRAKKRQLDCHKYQTPCYFRRDTMKLDQAGLLFPRISEYESTLSTHYNFKFQRRHFSTAFQHFAKFHIRPP